MEEPINFTVRPLPRGATLEGAFRVHIASKDLDSLKLKPGELCTLCTAEGTVGTGIAWRSTEQITKANTHPVKLTDTFRDAFNVKLGNTLTVSKTSTQVYHADRVVITDVSEHSSQDDIKDDTNWTWRCGNILGNVEAIANGVAFEATSRKGLRKRFLIESITSSTRSSSAIYYFDDQSELVLQDESAGPTPMTRTPALNLSAEGIGGLNKQIELLNTRLGRLIGEFRGRTIPANYRRNGGILLHGPEGTGKSMLLRRLAEASWQKVLKIDLTTLPGTALRNQAAISNVIAEAVARQPSLIIMDNLHQIAGTQNDSTGLSTAALLAAEFERLANTKVLVIGTTNNLYDIGSSLRCRGRFEYEIEIPVPDVAARIDILKVLHRDAVDSISGFEDLAEKVGERTHGFVGRDLDMLYRAAQDHAIERHLGAGDWVPVTANGESASLRTLVNGLDASRPSISSSIMTVPGVPDEIAEIDLSIDDFEQALLEVRPTAMKEVFLETPRVYWSQIGGSEEVKRTMTEVIEWPLKQAHNMARLGMTAEKGVLLYGPPGCSKTLTAKAVATSSGLNFIAVKGAELTSMYVGESERAVREVFRKARAAAPSIIFFDEIDAIASKRDSAGTKGLNVLTTLLNEMDGIESLKGVLVLAATNIPEVLDPALLRPGRFDTKIYIGPPVESARKEILTIRLNKVPVAADVDLERLAKETDGFSGAEMINVCENAAKETLRRCGSLDAEGVRDDDERRSIAAHDFEVALSEAGPRISAEDIEGYLRWGRK